MLTDEQLSYLYDYWANRTVPCLRLMGVDTLGYPSKHEFIDTFYSGIRPWNPYLPLYQESDVDWALVDFRCPPRPADTFGAFHPGQSDEEHRGSVFRESR